MRIENIYGLMMKPVMRQVQKQPAHKGPAANWRLFWPGTLLLLLLLFSTSAFPQFVKISLDVPVTSGVTEVNPLEFGLKTSGNSAKGELTGTAVFSISAFENLQIVATLTADDYLHDSSGNLLPLKVRLGYRNDGSNQLPDIDAGNRIAIPISNSGHLIGQISGLPSFVNAYLFIHADAGVPQILNTTYVGNINLNIEFN
jgi:hypothetical protein